MTTITIDRKVIEQALEALAGVAQWVEMRPDTHPWDAWQRVAPAMDALRKALAEPASSPAPVAWQRINTAHFRRKIPADANPGDWRPLYAAPPKREPLTDEEMYDAIRGCSTDLLELAKEWTDNKIHSYQFAHAADAIVAHAVKRAHGITGDAA